jgi:signal peptidase II
LLFFAILISFVALDQVTKHLVVQHIEYRRDEIKLIDGFLSLVHAQNQGAAFGMMSDSPLRKWLFPVFTVVAVVLLSQMVWQLPKNDRYQTTAVALIMAGAIGNFIDRMHKGSVTDFIRVYTDAPGPKRWLIERFGTNEWPSFNVADSAICIGIGLFVLHYFLFEKDDKTWSRIPRPRRSRDESEVRVRQGPRDARRRVARVAREALSGTKSPTCRTGPRVGSDGTRAQSDERHAWKKRSVQRRVA